MREKPFQIVSLLSVLAVTQMGCKLLKDKAAPDAGVATPAVDTVNQTETSTVTCGGNNALTFAKKTFDVASGPALRIGGHCAVSCTDCTIKAPEGISIGGNGTILLTGGTLEGSKTAIDAAGNATITVSGTQITGKTVRRGNATITGVPGLADNGQAEKLGKGACEGLFDCYQEHAQYGAVSGKVTVNIGADGNATSASYSGGSASRDVQKCMTDRAKTKKVAGANKAGILVCSYSGQYSKGVQELNYDETFQ